jgi:quinol-cytochrome oxidoreductase complex cytochrome b subunit
MTLGMAFTGQVLRFDQDAYWGLGIGASIASRVPFIGSTEVHMMLGGPKGAQGVGEAATNSVVLSSLLIIVADVLLIKCIFFLFQETAT